MIFRRLKPALTRRADSLTWRVIELWFDSVEAIDMAFVSRQGKELIEGLQQQGVTLDWVAMRNQELFFSFDADQPMEE